MHDLMPGEFISFCDAEIGLKSKYLHFGSPRRVARDTGTDVIEVFAPFYIHFLSPFLFPLTFIFSDFGPPRLFYQSSVLSLLPDYGYFREGPSEVSSRLFWRDREQD